MANNNTKVEQFFSQYPLRTYSKGQVLIHAGDVPQFIYYIEQGRIRQYDISYRGNEIVVQMYDKGDMLPMLWVMTGLNNQFFFDVEAESLVRIAPKAEVLLFLRANSDVVLDVLESSYIGVNGLHTKIVHLVSGSALNRILFELVVECRRFGETLEDEACSIKLNERDLAMRAGLSRETVSRELTKLKRDVNIKITRSGIEIGSMKALETKLANTF